MKRKKRKIKALCKILVINLIIVFIFKFTFSYLNDKVINYSDKKNIIIDNSYDNNKDGNDTEINDEVKDFDSNVVMNHDDDNLTIRDRLKKLVSKDNRINQIIDKYNDYPEQLLDMLSRNIELVDYVLDFLNEKGKTYGNDIGKIDNEVPLLLQFDKRWGYGKYGEDYVAMSGCGPTSLAMVIAYLTKDNSITPYEVAKFSQRNGYYVNGVGTSWSLMIDGAKKFGINSRQIPLSKQVIFHALENGHPIICSMKKGDFTNSGHFIVLIGTEKDSIKINDPNSKSRSAVLWSYERLEGQIKNLWEFYN